MVAPPTMMFVIWRLSLLIASWADFLALTQVLGQITLPISPYPQVNPIADLAEIYTPIKKLNCSA